MAMAGGGGAGRSTGAWGGTGRSRELDEPPDGVDPWLGPAELELLLPVEAPVWLCIEALMPALRNCGPFRKNERRSAAARS
jgi:hypothetical protein